MIDNFRRARRRRIKRLGKRTLRRLSSFMASQSVVGDPPVFDDPRTTFPFLESFESRWSEVRAELDQVLAHRDELPAFHEISPDQKRISRDDRWKTFILYGFRSKVEANCACCPVTTELLEQVPGLQTAWFSILSPRYHIPAHRGVTKGIVRAHLGLVVPDEATQCTMRVDDRTIVWHEGECVVFDDTYEHEVRNDTDEERIVLLFDFDRPMKLPGRVLSASMLWLLKRTAYYKDAQRNLATWNARIEHADRQAQNA
ncbi:MAG: aspartyl/asparaginyl beta-hydroxylase domain-containing protein [Gammaproteobacteria bacterium]